MWIFFCISKPIRAKRPTNIAGVPKMSFIITSNIRTPQSYSILKANGEVVQALIEFLKYSSY